MTQRRARRLTVGEMSSSRRMILKLPAMLGAALAVGSKDIARSESIRMRIIPSSGEHIPAVGLGTYRTFDVSPNARKRTQVKEVLRRFVAIGGRVIDSSPMYGRAERTIGDLATELGAGNRLFYATKVWTSGREAGIRQMKESLRCMRTTRMDLMQIHNLVDWRTHIKTLYAWRQHGEIRYMGITHYTSSAFGEMAAIMKRERLDFIQVPYSIISRQAETQLLPLAADRGIAVLVNEPFEQGALFHQVRGQPLPNWVADFDCKSWAQFFLKYILAHPAVTCPIPATANPKHLVDNMQAAFGRLPNDAQRQRMVKYMEGL